MDIYLHLAELFFSVGTSLQIYVARVEFFQGGLRRVRGTTLPIEVISTDSVKEVLSKSAHKHKLIDKALSGEDFKLLYSDFMPVLNIPRTSDLFTIESYKEFLGKRYQQILIFIVSEDDMTAVS